MVALLVILVLLAVVFGVGAVIEGLFWALVVGFALLVAAAWVGWRKLRGLRRS